LECRVEIHAIATPALGSTPPPLEIRHFPVPSGKELVAQPSGDWLFTESVDLDKSCRVDSVECSLPMPEIYHKVTIE